MIECGDEIFFLQNVHLYLYIIPYLYHIIYYIIKVGLKSCGCVKWLHQIAKKKFRFLIFFLKYIYIYIYNFSSSIISKLIKILI